VTITLPYRFDTTSVWHTIDVLLARADQRTGRAIGSEVGTLLELPVEEKNAPKVVAL